MILCNCEASILRLEGAVVEAQEHLEKAYEFAYQHVNTKPRLCKDALDAAEKQLTEAEIDLAIALGDAP